MRRVIIALAWVYMILGMIPAFIGFALGWICSPVVCGFSLGVEMGRDFVNDEATRWRNK